MTGLTIDIQMPRRRAEVTLSKYRADSLGLTEGIHPCYVLGLFQEIEDDNCAYPVFICEMTDGRVIEVDPTTVRFINEEEDEVHDNE